MNKRTFVITGANFTNKGAQAMLFVTVSELRERFENCEIIMTTWEDLSQFPLKFKFVSERILFDEVLEPSKPFVYRLKRRIGAYVHGDNMYLQCLHIKDGVKKIAAVIDISGYNLSSQWGVEASKNYLRRIQFAKKYNIPFYVMPQSIGPFDFGDKQKEMDALIAEVLPYAKHIFVRENSGYELLSERYGLNNVSKSVDLVLQNKKVDLSKVLLANDSLIREVGTIETAGNVAIIPNVRNLEHGGNYRKLIELYCEIISKLQNNKKKIYIIHHSSEDAEICKAIFDATEVKNNLCLVEQDFSCVEFNNYIVHFDFVIASRYHSIVHAYKNNVPAIVIGWAEKYIDLLKMFDQFSYMFDIRNEMEEKAILNAVDRMLNGWKTERNHIKMKLQCFQENNCFDVLSQDLR